MSEDSIPYHHPAAGLSAAQQLDAFQNEVNVLSAVRNQLAALGSIVAMQPGPPSDDQRDRLKELTDKHFIQGETVKALSMTLLSRGILTRCSNLVRQYGEGLH